MSEKLLPCPGEAMSALSEERVARWKYRATKTLDDIARSECISVNSVNREEAETILALIEDWKRLLAENEALREQINDSNDAFAETLCTCSKVAFLGESYPGESYDVRKCSHDNGVYWREDDGGES